MIWSEPIKNAIDFEDVMKLTRTVSGAAALTDEEAFGLYSVLTKLAPRSTVVEIGCQYGRSSSLIAQVGKELDLSLHFCDPFVDDGACISWTKMMDGIGAPYTLWKMKSDSGQFRNSIKVLGASLFYVDGDHLEDAVSNDLCVAAMSGAEYILAHDYGSNTSWIGVATAVDKFLKEGQYRHILTYGKLAVLVRNPE
jgi:hypothetical protein